VASAPPALATTGTLVSVGSPTGQHPQNAQNEPALAVDAHHPNILAAGSNDLVDLQPCSQQAATTAAACSFPLGTFNLGVGLREERPLSLHADPCRRVDPRNRTSGVLTASGPGFLCRVKWG
jgi:hypothetical protein